jgi:hypothetical protein
MPTSANDVQVRTREHANTWEHPHLNVFYFAPPACVVSADCDDSSLCTTDSCVGGSCQNTALSCTGNQTCDPASGQCVQCLQDADCSDSDMCTTDTCVAGSCANNAVTCGGGQTCDPASGQCTGGGNTFTTTYQEGVAGYAATVDTFLMESAPTTVRGTQADIEWDADDPPGSGLSNVMLVRMGSLFDTEGGLVPQGSSIVSATLDFTIFNPGGTGNLHETVVAWDNNTTYNTFGGDPGADPSEYGAQVGTIGGASGVQTVDVTASVTAWSQNPGANLGWVVLPTATDGVQARSREYATLSARPKLTITYQPPAGCLATCPTGTACRPRSQQCEGTTRYGFEHGYGWFGSLDTHLAQSTPNASHGSDQAAGWDNDDPSSTGQENIYLLKMGGLFDSEGGPVPAGVEIASALLRYWVVNSGSDGTLHESSVVWDESTTYNGFGGDPGVDATEISASIATLSGAGGVQSVDLTAQVQAWSNSPTSNLGLVVMPTGSNGVQLRTREHANTWEHPHLNVFYFTNP